MNESNQSRRRIVHRQPIHIPEGYERLVTRTLDACFRVHRELGPGLLEGVYEGCLYWELREMGLTVNRQAAVDVLYRGCRMETAFRADLIVDDGQGSRVLVELKSVAQMAPIFQAQVISYLRLLNLPIGLLVNFNTTLLKDGISRILNCQWATDPASGEGAEN